jgi:hypothetical protein
MSIASLADLVNMRRRIDHPAGRVRPPDLDDPAQYVRHAGVTLGEPGAKFRPISKVPVLDACDVPGKLTADEHDLAQIVANTNHRVERGEYPLLTIGHFREDQPETEQPPLVGYLRNFVLGTFRDEPCILADEFVDARYYDEVLTYPRRSVEMWASGSNPESNYIDSVAVLRRSPERDLGLVTFSRSGRVRVQMARESKPVLDVKTIARDIADAIRPSTPDRRLAQLRRESQSPGYWTPERRQAACSLAVKRGIDNVHDARDAYLRSLAEPDHRLVQLRREAQEPGYWTEERRSAMRAHALKRGIDNVHDAKAAYLEKVATDGAL